MIWSTQLTKESRRRWNCGGLCWGNEIRDLTERIGAFNIEDGHGMELLVNRPAEKCGAVIFSS